MTPAATRHAFVVDLNKCTGCHACTMACQIANRLPADRLWREVRTFNELHVPGVEVVHLSLACNHCADAPCLAQCPARAYSRDPRTGAVLIDEDRCLGCGYCAWVCPYGAPRLDAARGVMTKCTFCHEKLLAGERPACVTACPTAALEWRDLPDDALTQDTPGFAQAGTDPAIRVIGVEPRRRVPVQTTPPALPPWPRLRERLAPLVRLGHEWPLAVFTLLVAVLVALFTAARTGDMALDWRVFGGTGLASLLLSASHLGRRSRAWRAPLHLGRSWLSREIVLVSLFLAAGTRSLAQPPAQWGRFDAGALALGVLGLLAIDRVYGPARIRGAGPLHSAEVLLTGLMLAGAWTGRPWLLVGLAAVKLALFVVRQAHRRALGVAAPVGLVVPRLGFLVAGTGWLLGSGAGAGTVAASLLLLAGEALDRAVFYAELEIPTPQTLMLDELATRAPARGEFGGLAEE